MSVRNIACLCCNKQSTDLFCDACKPDTCYWCPASHVHYDNEAVYCSHGCEHTLNEYAHHHLYTTLLNGTPAEKLARGGIHVEIIIPNDTPITIHESIPDEKTVPDSNILATHYTLDKQDVLKNGIEYPPHEHSGPIKEWERGTIRENAVYAWPYRPEFTEETLAWSENPDNEYIIFELKESDVSISSYEFLSVLGTTEDTNFTIPHEKYEPELTFEIDAARRAVRQFTSPCAESELLI